VQVLSLTLVQVLSLTLVQVLRLTLVQVLRLKQDLNKTCLNNSASKSGIRILEKEEDGCDLHVFHYFSFIVRDIVREECFT